MATSRPTGSSVRSRHGSRVPPSTRSGPVPSAATAMSSMRLWPSVTERRRSLERALQRCHTIFRLDNLQDIEYATADVTVHRHARGSGGSVPQPLVYVAERRAWRDGRGRVVPCPADTAPVRTTRVVLTAAHLDHDPAHCGRRHRNVRALCQRCHLLHDRPEHRRRIRLTLRRRRALGDLFSGPYPAR